MLKRILRPMPLEEISIYGIDFRIKHTVRKNMKRIIMRVEQKNEILVSSAKVSKKRLVEFIQENRTWIVDQHINVKVDFEPGDFFYYLNEPYSVQHHKKAFCIKEKEVFIDPLRAKYQSDLFYKKSAKRYLPNRVEFWRLKMNLEFNSLSFRLAKKRWGSCNSKRNISLNPYMMKLSYEMIDYIIIHELSHLVHMNHSQAFYNHVAIFMPHYKKVEKEIKQLCLRII